MSLDIWEVKYNFAYGKLTDEEWNFIDRYIERDAYDGTFNVDEKTLEEAIKRAKENGDNMEELKDLIEALKHWIKKNDGVFSFSVS